MTVRELLIVFGFKVDEPSIQGLVRRLEDVKGAAGNAAEYAGKARDQLADLAAKAAIAATAIAGASAALIANSADVANAALFAERQAAAFGLTVEAYQELRSALGEFGVDQRDLADLLAQITQQAASAEGGATNIADAFGKLGISVADVAGKKPEAVLYAIAEGAAATTDEAARLSAASTLLGEDLTKKALPLLIQGAAGLDAYRKSARDLGVVMSATDVAIAKKFTTNLSNLRKRFEGVRMEVGRALIPVLTRLSDRMIDYFAANRAVISQTIDKYAQRVAIAFTFVADAVEGADRFVRSRLGGWEAILRETARAVGLLASAFVAFRIGSALYFGLAAIYALIGGVAVALGTTFAIAAVAVAVVAVAFGEVAASLTVILLVFDDFGAWLAGAPSLIGTVQEAIRGIGPAGEDLARILDAVRVSSNAAFDLLFYGGEVVVAGLGLAFDGVAVAVSWLGSELLKLIGYLATLPQYTEPLRLLADAITTTSGGFASFVEGVGARVEGPGGPAAGVFAPLFSGAAAGTVGASTTNNASTSNRAGDSISIVIDGARDPLVVAREVREALDARHRAALGAFAGGEL